MKQFFAVLDTPGGHIVVCLFLIVLSAILHKAGTPKVEDIIPFALGALARSMLGKNGRSLDSTEGNPKL